MSRAIPDYNRLVLPLQNIYENAMKGQPKRTKSVAKGISLSAFGWNAVHDEAFNSMKAAISRRTQLNYPDEDMVQCVFTDASQYHSSGMVTQIPHEDVGKLPFHDQRHEPLGFCGHRFHGSELNWSTPDKEAFAIWDTVRKLDYLVQSSKPFLLFTDHRNLTSMYNPEKCTKQAGERLERWGMDLRSFRFNIEHIPGDMNVWADMMTRWGAALSKSDIDNGLKGSGCGSERCNRITVNRRTQRSNGSITDESEHVENDIDHDARIDPTDASLGPQNFKDQFRTQPMSKLV
ncbi:hypothetical protein B5P41_29630, partial [Bacillus sp. SRB_28]